MSRRIINKRKRKLSNRMRKVRDDRLKSENNPILYKENPKFGNKITPIAPPVDRSTTRGMPCENIHKGHESYNWCKEYLNTWEINKRAMIDAGLVSSEYLQNYHILPIPETPTKRNHTSYYMSLNEKLKHRKEEIDSWGNNLTPAQEFKKRIYKMASIGKMNSVRNKRRR